MTSKSSSPKGIFDLKLIVSLFKKNLWLPTLAFISFLLAMPVATAMILQNRNPTNSMDTSIGTTPEQLERMYTSANYEVLSFFNVTSAMIITVGAVVAALFIFRYLHSKKQVDFYHSLPVRREKLFVSNICTGFLVFFIPYVVANLLNVIVIVALGFGGYMPWTTYLLNFACHCFFYITLFSFVTLGCMLAGTSILALCLSVFTCFVIPALITMFLGLTDLFFQTAYTTMFNLEYWLMQTSPVIRYYTALVMSMPWTSYLLWAGITIAVLVVSLLLYKARNLEKAGNSLAFKVSKQFIKIPVVVLGSLAFSIIFYSMNNQSLGWMYFGAVLGCIIISQILEIIFNSDFKAIKKGIVSLICSLVIVGGIIAYYSNDFLGYDKYMPQAENVTKINLIMDNVDGFDSYHYYNYNSGYKSSRDWELERLAKIELTDPQSIQAVLNLTSWYINNQDRYIHKGSGYDSTGLDGRYETYTTISIMYTLNNGKQVAREYWLPINQNNVDFLTIMNDEAYKQGKFTINQAEASNMFTRGVFDFYGGYLSGVDLTMAEHAELATIYKREFNAMNAKQRNNTLPIGYIEFINYPDLSILPANIREILESEVVRVNGSTAEYPYSIEYPIYAEFTETISYIQNKDKANVQPMFQLSADSISQIKRNVSDDVKYEEAYYGDTTSTTTYVDNKEVAIVQEKFGTEQATSDEAVNTIIITDPAEISKLIATIYPERAFNYSSFLTTTGSPYTIIFKNGHEGTFFSASNPEQLQK